jgi:hypothetical protein
MDGPFIAVRTRFTIDGSDALEQNLARLCAQVTDRVRTLMGQRLHALVLGGGYGRGQGGVLCTDTGEEPYNDLEFYVFARGSRLLNEKRFRTPLAELGEELSSSASLHVEFKLDSFRHFRRAPVTMFSYDLVSGHKLLHGPSNLFEGCAHHTDARAIPLSEATRLLFNRCTGLLLALEKLDAPDLTPEAADFIGRNLAKARLAFGDAVLASFGQYHWSCLERNRRLNMLRFPGPLPWIDKVRHHHDLGVQFKLHPVRTAKSRQDFTSDSNELSNLGHQLWMWVERRRLNQPFASVRDYSVSTSPKCPEMPAWRNILLNLRSFGARSAATPLLYRYPRERLFNSLPLLLWDRASETRQHLQAQLQTSASDWRGLLAAYKSIWPSYG